MALALMLGLCMAGPLVVPSALDGAEVRATKDTAAAMPEIHDVGDTIDYVMTVANPESNIATNIITRIWDTLPDGTVIEFLGPDETLVQAPGDTETFHASYTVDEADLEWSEVLEHWVVRNRFEVEGHDSLGDSVYVLVGRNSRVLLSGLRVRKLVNGEDASSPTGPVVQVGSTVTFDFVVTNAGQAELAPVVVIDDVLGSVGTIESLAPGASQTLSVTAAASAGQHSNLATVTGTPPTGPDVSATAIAHYYGSDSASPPANSEPRSIGRPALLAILIAIGVVVASGTVILARRHRKGA